MSQSQEIYIRFKGRVLGPITVDRARELLSRGQITRLHEISSDRRSWQRAEECQFLFPQAQPSNEYRLSNEDFPTQKSAPPGQRSNAASSDWHVFLDGERHGPVTPELLLTWIAEGKVSATTSVWKAGMDDWQPAGQVNPSWFSSRKHPTMGASPHATDLTRYAGFPPLPPGIVAERLRSTGWRLFLSIVIIVGGVVYTLASLAALFIAMSRRTGAGPGIAALFMVASSLAWIVAGILLLRFNSSNAVLKYNPALDQLHHTFERESLFWKFLGIFTLTWLSIVALMLTGLFLAGVEITGLITTQK